MMTQSGFNPMLLQPGMNAINAQLGQNIAQLGQSIAQLGMGMGIGVGVGTPVVPATGPYTTEALQVLVYGVTVSYGCVIYQHQTYVGQIMFTVEVACRCVVSGGASWALDVGCAFGQQRYRRRTHRAPGPSSRGDITFSFSIILLHSKQLNLLLSCFSWRFIFLFVC